MFKVDKYITTRELADKLKFSKHTIYIMIERDGLPYYRIGRMYRFKLSEVKE